MSFFQNIKERYLKDLKQLKQEEYLKYIESVSMPVEGRLKVIGTRNGKVFHYDEGHNKVMIWAKHAMMKIIAGDLMCEFGESRNRFNWGTDSIAPFTPWSAGFSDYKKSSLNANYYPATDTDQSLVNGDGTLVSNYQYKSKSYPVTTPGLDVFYNYKSTWEPSATRKLFYPYMPTKMLFGTMNVNGSGIATNDTTISPYVDTTPNSGYNLEINARETGILGDIRSGFAYDRFNKASKTSGAYAWQPPSFIYVDRPNGKSAIGGNIELNKLLDDGSHLEENLLSFTVVMPEQLDSSDLYPYNDYNLKVAGLFCDAHYTSGAEDSAAHIANLRARSADDYTSQNPYNMKYGMMWAKRYIDPIVKTANSAIYFKWTFSV
jgi:hypothetical protein